MHGIIARWGNSLAIRIPKAAVEAVHFREGDRVTITEEGSALLIAHASSFDIDDLISKITPENLHVDEEWIESAPRGAEW